MFTKYALLFSTIVVLFLHGTQVNAGTGLTPLETQECVRRDGVGACREYAKTFTVQGGISCSEECQGRDGVGACRYQSKCNYDEASGCFAKEICESIGLRGCERTRIIAVCNYTVRTAP